MYLSYNLIFLRFRQLFDKASYLGFYSYMNKKTK